MGQIAPLDTIQLSIAEQKNHDELEAKQNVEKVKEHLIAEEIEKLVEETENVKNDEVDNSISNSQNDPSTRLDPRSYKESLEVEKTADVQPVNVIEEGEESTEDNYKLRRREKGRICNSANLRAEISSQINNAITNHIPSHVDSSVRNYMSDNPQLQHNDLPIWLALKIKFEGLHASNTPCRSSSIRLRDQDDPHDDAHPEGENSAKRQKTSKHGTYVFGESSSGDEHQYHIDQMQNFLKNDIMWESRREILTLPFPQKPTPIIQSCQRDPKAPTLSPVNQDLLYLKKGNSRPEKIMLSLQKFHVVIFPDDDIEERTSRWIFYIKRQKEPGKPKEEIYSNSKIFQVIKTYGELGHEHKFVTEIITRRENGSIVSITKPDYKNLNKNDIEDMYLLCINGKVDDYAKTGLLWSLSVFIRSTLIWERVHDFQLVYGIIYKNSKKEKRVMRHQEIHKFYDATLKRVLEGLKSYNNDVKHGYVTPSLGKEDVEYL
ncbi:hypothetical protein Tco_0026686 [Tanacetum coccineum]